MDFQIGTRVWLTEDSEWAGQNKRYDEYDNEYEVKGTIVGTYINKETQGKFDRNFFTRFKYAVRWDEDSNDEELYYNDEDLRLADVLPVTNQEAKNRLSKEW